MRLRTQNTSFAAAAVGSFQKNEVKNRPPKRKRRKRRITDETDSAHPRKSKQYHFGVPFVSPAKRPALWEELWLKHIRKKEGEEFSRAFM
jgi:hypothetical protein